jgi:hypothetical protein
MRRDDFLGYGMLHMGIGVICTKEIMGHGIVFLVFTR